MINFRYHVVSIVAVFLALAIGIVLGATELQGATLDALRASSKNLANDLNTSQVQNRALEQQVTADQGFAQADEGRLLGGLLTNQRVVVVVAPGAPAAVITGVTSAVQKAGAVVTGQVNLQPKLLDASENNLQFLSALVQQLVSSGIAAPSGTPLQQTAQLLGSAILTKNDPSGSPSAGSTGGPATTRQNVLSYYARAGLLNVSGPLSTGQSPSATLAIVVTPATPPPGGDSVAANQGLITLAEQLNTASLGTVMAGSVTGSVAGSAINALRATTVSSRISTVDDADTLVGQIVTVQALALALTGHKAGSYGEGPASKAAGPSPAPTPASSSPATTSPGTKTSSKQSTKSGSRR